MERNLDNKTKNWNDGLGKMVEFLDTALVSRRFFWDDAAARYSV